MSQFVCQSTVICQEKQSVGVHVETPDGVEPQVISVRVLDIAAEVGDVIPAFFIARSADDAARLVEHDADFLVGLGFYRSSVEYDLVTLGVNLLAKLCYMPVDSDVSFFYFLFGGAARHDTAVGKEF